MTPGNPYTTYSEPQHPNQNPEPSVRERLRHKPQIASQTKTSPHENLVYTQTSRENVLGIRDQSTQATNLKPNTQRATGEARLKPWKTPVNQLNRAIYLQIIHPQKHSKHLRRKLRVYLICLLSTAKFHSTSADSQVTRRVTTKP